MNSLKDKYYDLHQNYINNRGNEFDAQDIENSSISYAYNTCGIEGNTITLGETETIIKTDKVISNRSLTEHMEIKDAYNAFKSMWVFARENFTMNEQLAMTFHKLNTKSWLDDKWSGKYKTINNRFGGRSTPYPGKAKNLFKKMFDTISNEKDPFTRACKIHLETVIIHPWQDGNGRTARLIMNYELVKNGHGHIQISKKNKDSYFEAIRKSINDKSHEPFIQFMYKKAIDTYQLKIDFLTKKKIDQKEMISIWDFNDEVNLYID